MNHYKKLIITFAITFSSCSELYVLTYKTSCSRGNMAYYFSNDKGIEYTVVDSCSAYEYGKKVTYKWIMDKNK